MRKLILQLVYPDTVKFRCPNCDAEIPFYAVKIGFRSGWAQEYFRCSSCETLLSVSAAYAWTVFISTLVTSIFITSVLGLRWFIFLPAAFLIWLLVVMVGGGYVKVLIPPKIKQYYPGDDLSLIQRRR